jgi:hypothetical protein
VADPTLAEAIEMHLRAMRAKGCAARSMEAFRDECARHLAGWLARSLGSIRRNECAVRHEELTDRCGPYLANRVLQQFRAVYDTAAQIRNLSPYGTVIEVLLKRREKQMLKPMKRQLDRAPRVVICAELCELGLLAGKAMARWMVRAYFGSGARVYPMRSGKQTPYCGSSPR